jgi:hypothetical protein
MIHSRPGRLFTPTSKFHPAIENPGYNSHKVESTWEKRKPLANIEGLPYFLRIGRNVQVPCANSLGKSNSTSTVYPLAACWTFDENRSGHPLLNVFPRLI